MKITYITRVRMPTEKAHGLQIAKMCEAYAKLGHEVELTVPYRKNTIQEDVFTYYSLERNFSVNIVSIFDTIRLSKWLPRIAFWFQAVLFLWVLRKKPVSKDTTIMTRSFDVAWWYTRRGYRVIAEVHDFSRRRAWWNVFLLKNVDLLVCNSEGTEKTLHSHGLARTMVAHNGVDIESMRPHYTRDEMRERWNISKDAFVVMYVGALEDWKGYKTVLEASLQCTDIVVVIVGGKSAHIEELRAEYPHVAFLGQQPYREVANFQNMADVLLIPNDPMYVSDQEHTSPIKLFTSLASGIPLITTNLPNIRVLVDTETVMFFDGSVDDLVRAIKEVKKEYAVARNRAEKALAFAQQFTWQKRAEKIAFF